MARRSWNVAADDAWNVGGVSKRAIRGIAGLGNGKLPFLGRIYANGVGPAAAWVTAESGGAFKRRPMVARAKAVSWFNLVASLLVGATAQSLVFEAVAHAGTGELVVAQVSSRATQAHTALSKAIESYRQGDYEIADAFFKEVLPRRTDLTPTEQEEFKRFWQDNVNALAARETANRQLHEAEKALLLGHNTEAATLAKKVSVNEQYMTAADKLKLADLSRQLKLPSDPSTPETKLASPEIVPPTKLNDKKVVDPALAPVKVQQARVQFSQLDFEACEKSLVEAEALKAAFASSEDSPAKVREDLAKAKADPKVLLAAAERAGPQRLRSCGAVRPPCREAR